MKRSHDTALSRQLLVAGLAICGGVSAPVPAALAQGLVLEEVVVTARRREESLQETPVAVSAFSEDDMRAAQITGVADLTAHVPGLTRREGRKEADLAIRGVGTRAVGANIDPGVGVYVDGIFIPRSDSQLVDAINLESMQVLRGPQGTLFGKNTAGGALLLTTKKPGEEYEGFATGDFGDLGRTKLRLGHSGPFTERLAGGIVLDYVEEDGYREDNETGREYGDKDTKAVLGQLSYMGDYFSADLLLFWGEREENIAPANCVRGEGPSGLGGFTAPGEERPYEELCARSEDLIDNEDVLLDREEQPWEMTNQMAGLTLQWDIGDMQVKSITGYLYQDDIIQGGDVDSTPLFAISNRVMTNRQLEGNGIDAGGEEREFISQEFQLIGSAFDGFMDFTVGLFGSVEDIDESPTGNLIGPGGFVGIALDNDMVSVVDPSNVGFRGIQLTDYDNESVAGFTQVILNFTDYWQFTLGGRYTWEKKEVSQISYGTATESPGIVTREEFDGLENFIHDLVLNPEAEDPTPEDDEDWTQFTPAATITYFAPESWTDGALSSGMFYLSYSEGFKAGGFTPFGNELRSFDPEEISSYELGAKMDLLDSTLRINTSVYYSEYDDMQLRVTRTIDDTETLDGIVNAGEATIWGAEIEVSWLPTDALLLGLTGSYTDAEYDEFLDEDRNGNPVPRDHEDFAYIPEQTYTLTAQYTFDLAIGELSPRLSGYYKDDIFIGLSPGADQQDVAYLDDYWLWNLRAAFRPSAIENLEIAAYVNNLFDEEYVGTGIYTSGIGAASYFPGKQQTWGVQLAYSW